MMGWRWLQRYANKDDLTVVDWWLPVGCVAKAGGEVDKTVIKGLKHIFT